MEARRALCRETAVLTGLLLLLQLTHLTDGSLVFNATQFSNSSHSKDMPTGLAQVHVHKQRSAEEPGSGGLSETSSSTSPSTTTTNLNADSVELEHVIGVVSGGMGAGLPTLSGSRTQRKPQLDFKDEDEDEDFEDSDPRWHSEILQPDGSLVDLERRHQPITNTPPAQFTNQPDNHIIQVSFNQPDRHQQIETPPTPQLQELQGGDPTSWTLSDFYDYLSPDYSTTDGYPEEDQPTPVDMEDENVRQVTKAASSNLRPFAIDDGASGGYDPAGPAGAVEAEDSSGCLLGFVRRNGTCQSPCELFTNYCYNGGQCFVMDGIGAFCRCNMQSYIWNKGTRCESVITEFQVMCIVVGGTSLVVLVLFMVIVFFSKRLHLLKIENRRLRKRSKFRPQSEQQNDNFSLSTIAEGSQANKTMSKYIWEYRLSEEPCGEEDTAKQEEPSKSPTKEDESLNIQNSLTPKLENNKSGGEENAEEGGVTIDLELLLPKEAKQHPETSPPLHYNVFLYKLPKSPKKSPVLRRPPGRSGHARSLSTLCPRRGSEPGYSPISTRSLPPMPTRTPNPRPGQACTP
ncbi:chondroitin sulfate proteoglycan 5b isoform X2 [Astyanax mexicanus]|uniref:chondroitin sulfate proteoglycan 5b isoform X2 n=1 Tax=Astyanax mexicanus TaxID=7994 RepID=UPI0020CB478A|nr:chondroitin sulfate proteoglycan 5b isoform X2 [Astyanax mexicanus]